MRGPVIEGRSLPTQGWRPYHLAVSLDVPPCLLGDDYKSSRNWGLTATELTTIPPALARSFSKDKKGGFGSDMGENWGPLLMRGARNADLYGPLQEEWIIGKEQGTDVWIHKNRYFQFN